MLTVEVPEQEALWLERDEGFFEDPSDEERHCPGGECGSENRISTS